MYGATAATIAACARADSSSAVTKAARQRRVGALQVAVQPPGVVLDRELLEAAVAFALLARVAPAEGRLDAVAGVVGKGQADGAGGRDRQQVRVAQPMLADALLQRLRQARGEGAGAEVQVGVEQREGAALARQLHRRAIGRIAHHLGDAPRPLARGVAVVVQVQHGQRIAQAGEAQADAALVRGFLLLLRQRPDGGVEHVVEHARGDRHHLDQRGLVEGRVVLEGPLSRSASGRCCPGSSSRSSARGCSPQLWAIRPLASKACTSSMVTS